MRVRKVWTVGGVGAMAIIAVVAIVAAATAGAHATRTARTARTARSGRTAAAKPAADCQPYSSTPCLLPFPSNLFTRPDKSSATGLRVALPAKAMPVNTKGSRVGTAP
jgi:hypothetical protein